VVYALNPDNTVRSVPIQPGPKVYGYRVVRTGLKGDERIVVKGIVRVRPGIKVDPVETVLNMENKSDVPPTAQEAAVATGAVR
jgi:hypothetical protein